MRLGKALDIFRHPERIVAGVRDAAATRRAGTSLRAVLPKEILWMRPESAEMTKHGINAWLALSVTFANEIARLCEAVGADAREVERGLRSEPRIGQKAYIRPGAAFAGGTLARDVVALTQLAREHGEPAAIFPAILAGNEAHKDWALGRLRTLLDPLAGATVAVLGLTYKPGTDTLRRSGAVELCAKTPRGRRAGPLLRSRRGRPAAGTRGRATLRHPGGGRGRRRRRRGGHRMAADQGRRLARARRPDAALRRGGRQRFSQSPHVEQIPCVEYFAVGTPAA